MKKILIILTVVVAVVAFLAYRLVSNLDDIVKSAIENVGSEALGVEVSVGSVSIDLAGGTGTIGGLEIANPPGYSGDPALSVGELTLELGPDDTVARLHLGAPAILVEPGEDTNNFADLMSSLSEPTATDGESDVVTMRASLSG
jgi:hypothetical protein